MFSCILSPARAMVGILGLALGLVCPAVAEDAGVQIKEDGNVLHVSINGEPFTDYHFKDVPRPYYYPLLGPGEVPMTRNFPMQQDSTNEEHDHPHHRSLWYAHGAVNGNDFWSEQKNFGTIVHTKFDEIKSGKDVGVIKSENKWVDHDGKVVCTDERVMRIYNEPKARLFDFDITIHASNGEVTFGDTKEGSMALRLAETMRLKQPKGKPGQGHIVNSEGVRDDQTWGKSANWVDYYGPVDGKTLGIAIFDHPENPRHPTTWHVRDYGLFAANPFGLHDFEKKPEGIGNLVIPAGKSVTFRYRFYVHEGNERQAKVAEKYEAYAQSSIHKSK
ncbi:PmoA family protein [Pedosphaera parvula]|uniref:Transmembrane protein n=1 Tax=Pedosphaera parvula (strain Ellin514) TaxID=320771 RepID=B9XN70_PEDPL|nr:PmoA family protein [Pedosphaera parvula]EEF58732.1 transmembrane protein [Pedosphaera parvula Ellin514]